MNLFRILVLCGSLSLLYSQSTAEEPKSFDETFQEVKDKASSSTQSADKINTPKRIDEPEKPIEKQEESSNALIIVTALALAFGGVVVGRITKRKPTT